MTAFSVADHFLPILGISFSFPSAVSPAANVATLALAITIGLGLGSFRFGGIRLGVSGVLFSSLLFGQFGLTVDAKLLEFLRDFALIIFVYAIGLQVGPGFVSSLRAEGLRLNLLSLATLILGTLFTAAIIWICSIRRDVASGLYAGAFTTTPALAAGQETLRNTLAHTPDKIASAMAATGLAYTVCYPFGVVGPSLAIVLLRKIFRIDVAAERASLVAAGNSQRPPLGFIDFEVTEAAHANIALKDHPLLSSAPVYFSRLYREKTVRVPNGETLVLIGDVFRAAGPRAALNEIVAAMGRPSDINLDQAAGDVKRMDLIVTRTHVLRRSLRELDLIHRMGVTVSRVNRAGVELPPRATLRLQFGDRVSAVGPEAGLKLVESEVGNCTEMLNRPQLVPIFVGIVIGVAVGSIPLAVPGLSLRLKIGLAGGPMLAAIALSQLGNVGSIVWYMPVAANQLFRDFGLAIFLACVGMQSGDHFFQRVASGGGVTFILWGALITVLPVAAVGAFARAVLKMNFVTLSGWVAGAMTSSPALLFANELTDSDAPAVAYAAVAPLGMLTPIVCAQLLVILMR